MPVLLFLTAGPACAKAHPLKAEDKHAEVQDKSPAPTARELLRLRVCTDMHTAAFSADGQRVVSCGLNNTVIIWDAARGKTIVTFHGQSAQVLDAAFSPDGKRVASAGRGGARVWDAATGKEAFAIVDSNWVARVAFSPDGRCLAAACVRDVALWDVRTGRATRTLSGHNNIVSSVAFSPDGKRLASAGLDHVVKIWNVAGGQQVFSLDGHTDGVDTVAFSPDGKWLASACQDHTVKLWEAATGRLVLTISGHTAAVHTVAFSPDGQRLATASADKTVRLWQTLTGRELFVFKGHRQQVYSAAFDPDGRRLVSTGADGLVMVWRIVPSLPDLPWVALRSQEKEERWADLACGDPALAYRAVATLVAGGGPVVPFLAGRLRPILPADARRHKRVDQLLADLDSKQFRVRQNASKELAGLGAAAEPALRKALASPPSLEVRRRLEGLLEQLPSAAPSPEHLRLQRAVAVLEYIGSPEARQLLSQLAAGVPEAQLTQEAAASLERMRRRPTNSR
ncbi:MAG TPA: WD40 repeat domain-containing protein [Gemmataceae bacterium]|nr:WD40 repeat domain-containing protein [Gemmataceae bacterium]